MICCVKMIELRGEPFDCNISVSPSKQASKRAAAGPSRFNVNVTRSTISKTIWSQLVGEKPLLSYCWEFLKSSETSFRLRLFQLITVVKTISIPELLNYHYLCFYYLEIMPKMIKTWCSKFFNAPRDFFFRLLNLWRRLNG